MADGDEPRTQRSPAGARASAGSPEQVVPIRRWDWLPVVVGLVGFISALIFSPDDPPVGWPSDAAQILATLFIAVAIEARLFFQVGEPRFTPSAPSVRTTLNQGLPVVVISIWSLSALFVSITAAAFGAAFTPLLNALVIGGIVTLGGVIFLALTWIGFLADLADAFERAER
jgi:hypothetical protein